MTGQYQPTPEQPGEAIVEGGFKDKAQQDRTEAQPQAPDSAGSPGTATGDRAAAPVDSGTAQIAADDAGASAFAEAAQKSQDA